MGLIHLNDLFLEQLHCLYDAEQQQVVSLPAVVERVTSAKLKATLDAHLAETVNHVRRLEQISSDFRIRSLGHPCKGMRAILEEAQDFLAAKSTPEVLDAAIIAVCDRIESYEIAAYANAHAIAELLGSEIASKYLHQTLAEERVAGRSLVSIATGSVNDAADNW